MPNRPRPPMYRIRVREGGNWHEIPGVYTEASGREAAGDYQTMLGLAPGDVQLVRVETPEPGFHRPFEGLGRMQQARQQGGKNPALG